MTERVSVCEISRENSKLLKGIAILLLLLGHAYYIPYAGAIAVAVFLMQSGYGLNSSCEKNGLAFYWNKRIRKVWLPYVIVGLFDVLALRVAGLGPILCTLVGLDLGLIADKTMWYISYMLLWYLCYYLAMGAAARVSGPIPRKIVKLGLLLAASFGFRWLFSRGFWHPASAADCYIFAFPLGVLMSELSAWKVSNNCRSLLWLGVLFLSSAYLFRFYPFSWNGVLLTTVAAAQVLSILQLCRLPKKAASAVAWFGKYSYPIYLFEGLILNVREVWFGRLGLTVLIDLCYFAVTVGFAVVFWTGYERLESILPWKRILR